MKKYTTVPLISLAVLVAFIILRVISNVVDWCPPNRCIAIIRNDLLDLLRFEWVYRYQTLLGGLAALGAGAFVLSAAKLEIQAADNRERERERSLIVDALLQISTYFHRCHSNLERKKMEGLKYADTTEAFIPQATRCSATLGYLIPASIDLIKSKLADNPPSELQVRQAAMVAFAIASIFLESAKAIKKSENAMATIQGGNMKFDGTIIRKKAITLRVDYDTIRFLSQFFTQPNVPQK